MPMINRTFKILALIFILHSAYFPLHSQTMQLWGMCNYGGTHNDGAIFKINEDGTDFKIVYSFDSLSGTLPTGSLFKASNGKLYGMTSSGGGDFHGTLFCIDPIDYKFTKLIDFTAATGTHPYNSLMQGKDGKLYGVTEKGGDSLYYTEGHGVLFSYDINTKSYKDLHIFNGRDGSNPKGSLIQLSNGKLYGTSTKGGKQGTGVIFCYDPATNTYTDLFDFLDYNKGTSPCGSLILANNGKLYGLATNGGTNSRGIIFSFDIKDSVYKVEFNMFGHTGGDPFGSFAKGNDGKLYAMTRLGGAAGYGSIFSFNPADTAYAYLHHFDNKNGLFPYGSLIFGSNNLIYGMTNSGSDYYDGNIFSFNAKDSVFKKLFNFDVKANCGYPYGDLLELPAPKENK